MICPNCGRELAEGEICTCQQQPIYEAPATAPAEPVAPAYEAPAEPAAPAYEAPVYNPPVQDPVYDPAQGYYDPNAQQVPPYQQPYYPQPPMQPMVARTDYPEGYKIKKKYIAVILAFAFNGLGLYNFYLGNKTKGIIQVLLCTVGSIFLGLGPVAATIWAVVEGVLLLTEQMDTDADGFKIQTFEESLAAQMKKD